MPLTNGSGSMRPKNIRIRRIRIRSATLNLTRGIYRRTAPRAAARGLLGEHIP